MCENNEVELYSEWYPELYTDEDIDKLATKVYNNCFEANCERCPHSSEVEDGVCKVDIINELWRKWKNAKNYIANQERHVYCIDCKHIDYDTLKDTFTCTYKFECNLWDPEDSKPFCERPYYEERISE